MTVRQPQINKGRRCRAPIGTAIGNRNTTERLAIGAMPYARAGFDQVEP